MNSRERQRRSGLSPIVISLLLQLYQHLERFPYKPPVTIALLALNLFVHLHPYPVLFDYALSDIRANCVHPALIVFAWTRFHVFEWHRLVLSAIIHADDVHLYYNLLSLCWKGANLELAMGSYRFLGLVVFSWIVSHSLLVLLASALYFWVGMDGYSSGFDVCAVGFSAVLFSLKYVLNATSDGESVVMGFRVPTKHAAWLELVAISLISPNASFLGHLAGILAGAIYMHGPLEVIFAVPLWFFDLFRKLFGSRTEDSARDRDGEGVGLETEEELREQRRRAFNASDPLNMQFPDEHELRQQRMRRFNVKKK